MRNSISWLLASLLIVECIFPVTAEAGRRRRCRVVVCPPACVAANPATPSGHCTNPGPTPVPCELRCPRTPTSVSTTTYVNCPKQEVTKYVINGVTYYDMQCDRCRRDAATPMLPRRCSQAGSSVLRLSSNQTVSQLCNADTTNCQSCTTCVCTTETGAVAYALCGCRTSVEFTGLIAPAKPSTLPQLAPGTQFVMGYEPQRVRVQLGLGGPLADVMVYQVQAPSLPTDDPTETVQIYSLGYQVETTDDAVEESLKPAIPYDSCAYLVSFRGIDFRVVVAPQ